MTKHGLNEWRASLGLDPLLEFSWDASPVVHMYSPLLAPRPSDWPQHVYDCGFCFLEDCVDNAYNPDPKLVEFLASGSAPIYFGFGSMPVVDIQQQLKMFSNVCSKLERRGVVLCSNLDEVEDITLLSDRLFLVNNVPHWWLFPQCCVAVFHGGAGTTAVALKAGIPCEFILRVFEIGLFCFCLLLV